MEGRETCSCLSQCYRDREKSDITLHNMRHTFQTISAAVKPNHFKPITPCTTQHASLHGWIKIVTNHLRPSANPFLPPPRRFLPTSPPHPSRHSGKSQLTFTQIITLLKKEKKKRKERQWIHLNNYANQTGDEAFINIREVLHQTALQFIRLLQLKMNTLWLVWCHYGVCHIIVLGSLDGYFSQGKHAG